MTLYPLPMPLLIAALLDFLIADPIGWLHPVQIMGWAIARYGQWALAGLQQPLTRKLAGIGLGIGLIGGSGLVGWWLVALGQSVHPGLGLAVESVLLASCFAARSLRNAANDVLNPLERGDLATARSRLSRYVGRDTATLSESEILRAVLETVTENATDGVMAPLFYAIVGVAIPGVGSVPLALAYKAASTLDSMVGYKEAPYTDLGWFSAKIEDGLTWLPCRLTVGTIALLSGKFFHVWKICWRDAPQDPSPNSGWSECAYAAALGVQVGGMNWYRGIPKPKPLLGDARQPLSPAIIHQSLQLTRWSFWLWLIGIIAVDSVTRLFQN